MGDARYPFEKLVAAMGSLVSQTMDPAKAVEHALTEFTISFRDGDTVPEWAKERVAAVREIARLDDVRDMRSGEGTIAAWVRSASEDDLERLRDAILSLFIAATQENERQHLSPRR